MPRESPDAPEDLPKDAPGQVTFGQLEDEVSSVPNEAPAGLEQPLLETREGPALEGDRQDQPAQEVTQLGEGRREEQDPAARLTHSASWSARALCSLVASDPAASGIRAAKGWGLGTSDPFSTPALTISDRARRTSRFTIVILRTSARSE